MSQTRVSTQVLVPPGGRLPFHKATQDNTGQHWSIAMSDSQRNSGWVRMTEEHSALISCFAPGVEVEQHLCLHVTGSTINNLRKRFWMSKPVRVDWGGKLWVVSCWVCVVCVCLFGWLGFFGFVWGFLFFVCLLLVFFFFLLGFELNDITICFVRFAQWEGCMIFVPFFLCIIHCYLSFFLSLILMSGNS